jgi:hypothetical protein
MVRYYPQLDPDFSQTWSCLKQNLLETYGNRDPDPPDESQEHSPSEAEHGEDNEQGDGDDTDHEEESYYDSEDSNHSEDESDYEDDPDYSDRDQEGSDNSEYETDYEEDEDQSNLVQSTNSGLSSICPRHQKHCDASCPTVQRIQKLGRILGSGLSSSTYNEDGKVNDEGSSRNLESEDQPNLVQSTHNGLSFICPRHQKQCYASCPYQRTLLLLKLNPEAYQEEWEDGLDNLPPVPEYFCRTHKDLCSEEYCAYLREGLRSPYFNEEAAYYCRQHDAHCEIDCPHIDEALNPRQETRSEARYRCDLHSRRPCKATCLLIKLLIDEDKLYAENNALFLCREHRKYCAATDCSHIEGLPFSYADQKENSDDDNYDDEDDEPPSLEEINTALAWATSIDDKTNQGLLTEEEAFLAGVDAAMKEGGILLDVVTTLRTQLVPYPYDQNWPTLRAATLGFYELYADNEDLSQMLNQGHADHDLTGDTSLPPLDDYGHWPTLRASILDFYGLPESGNLNKVLTRETESKEVPNNDPDSNRKPESLKRADVSNLPGVATPNLEPKDPPVTSTLVH